MHFQASEPNWHQALLRMPDGASVKAFDAGLLKDAKQTWAAAGRDPARLTTVLRHADFDTSPREAAWEEAKAHMRRQFAKFVDGTYLREYASFVDVVSEANEYWSITTWTDPDGGAGVKRSMLAAQAIWNDEYRGRLVRSADGGEGRIPANCRIALGAVTVSHDWPKDLLQATIAGDNIADYHAYMRCVNGVRAEDDWRNHSGRWNRKEQEYGLKPRWFFGECGPYISTEGGWRDPACLGGSLMLLTGWMGRWYEDVAASAAYREGRLVGQGAWFTSGGVGWKDYQLHTPELIALADVVRPMWKPGDEDMDQDKMNRIAEHARAILVEVGQPVPWWQRPTPYAFTGKPTAILPLYNENWTFDRNLNYSAPWVITVREIDPAGWLRVTGGELVTDEGKWIKAPDITPA